MIVAVTGGKGGVGKSTVALELAAALDAPVVDADLGMADLPRGRGPDLHDVLAGRAAPHEALVRHGGASVVHCGRSLAGARAAVARDLPDALGPLERTHGTVLVDCPAGLRADAGVPLAVADAAVLVTRPSATALADAVRTRALARRFDAPLVRVVCNRATGDVPADGVADLLGAPVVALPEDPALARTLATGRPVAARREGPRRDRSDDATDADAVRSALETLADAVRRAAPGPASATSR